MLLTRRGHEPQNRRRSYKERAPFSWSHVSWSLRFGEDARVRTLATASGLREASRRKVRDGKFWRKINFIPHFNRGGVGPPWTSKWCGCCWSKKILNYILKGVHLRWRGRRNRDHRGSAVFTQRFCVHPGRFQFCLFRRSTLTHQEATVSLESVKKRHSKPLWTRWLRRQIVIAIVMIIANIHGVFTVCQTLSDLYN